MCPADSNPPPTDPPREGVPTRSEGRVPAAAMGAMRPLHLLTVPAVRMPRAPTPPPPPCLLHLSPRLWPHQAVPRGPRGANPLRTHWARNANPLREPTFSRTHFPRTHANPLRTHLFCEPTSRTHANPMRTHLGVSHATPLGKWVRGKWVRTEVGSRKSGFEWRQSRTHLASGFEVGSTHLAQTQAAAAGTTDWAQPGFQ